MIGYLVEPLGGVKRQLPEPAKDGIVGCEASLTGLLVAIFNNIDLCMIKMRSLKMR